MKLILALIMAFSVCSAQLVGPKISVQQKEFDFGSVTEGEQVSHDFIVYNTGGDTLVIKDVRASCGCTAAKPQKNRLLPGESTSINVRFNTSGRSGKQQKHVYVTSNDNDTPEIRLSFTAFINDSSKQDQGNLIFPKLKIDEVKHDFGVVDEGKVIDWTVRFTNTGNSMLEIKDVKTSCGCTAAVLSGKKINPGDSGTLKVEFDTSNREGKTSKTITLLSNDPDQPNQTLIITADIHKRMN